MKVSIVILLFLSGEVFSNIAPSKAFISEIYIDSLNNWEIELGFPEKPEYFLDSLFIETESGIFKVTGYQIIKDTSKNWFPYLTVITNDNLSDSLTLNRYGDFVKVISFLGKRKLTDKLVFGNRKNSHFLNFKEGHSIAYIDHFHSYNGFYSLDNSPTIGRNNTEEGVSAIIKGYLLNKNNEPVPNTELMGFVGELISDDKGYFEGEIISQSYKLDTFKIRVNTNQLAYIYKKDTITALPDSTINRDIVLYSIINNTPVIKIDSSEFKVETFPNPFINIICFKVTLPYSTNLENATFQLFSLSGQLILSKKIENHKYFFFLYSDDLQNMKPGVYIYSFVIDNKRFTPKNNKILKID